MLMSGESDFRPVTSAAWDAAARLEDLDAAGIDIQVISATPILFQWDRPAEVALDVARHFNDDALNMCAGSGGRLRALCQVPLQDVDSACRELERSMANGHVGVHIGNHVGARDLDDPELVTFLQHCAALDAPVLVHPWDMDPIGGRLQQYMMGWTVGMPMETHLSICAMVLGGAFDRLPSSLRLCFAHGGGAFPYLLGRLENAWHERSIARGKSLHPPSHYLDRFSVDSAVFDERALRLLVETMGAERVMLGSDYPFPLGEQKIGSLVRGCAGLTDSERGQVLGANAMGFFGLASTEAGTEEAVMPKLQVTAAAADEPLPLRLRPARRAITPPHLQQASQQQQQAGTRSLSTASAAHPPSAAAAPAEFHPYLHDVSSRQAVEYAQRRQLAALSQGHSAAATWFDDIEAPPAADASLER